MKLSEPQALNRVAAYCSRAERSEFSVRKKLLAWELSPDAIERIMDRLRKEKYLDNTRFTRSFINDKLKFNKWGKTKIIFELRKLNISESIYTPILEDLAGDEFEKQLMHILSVKEKSVKAKNDYDKKTKLIRFALGRGFSMDLCIKCVDKILGGTYEDNFS
ncbi:Regulatory protein RecX [uncultured Dysgonomonas sp.]|uniref:Regulatory protein RecX n=1 Tax=uncultured Dysgonomonas sp. TaxID=206096 RepID=A0A212K2D5_9BACT|nr:regulatory protein RecX [uncultured Dysgonomonas sp.]SBW05833.1 Regulatory protein RecX [uncultured Dysgonomonas sp.]